MKIVDLQLKESDDKEFHDDAHTRFKLNIDEENTISDIESGELFPVDEDGLERALDNANNMHNLIVSLIGKCVENSIDINSEIGVWCPEYDGTHGIDLDTWND